MPNIPWDFLAQYGVLLSAVGFFFTARKSKWGWIIGLCAQPFWYITSIKNGQWGVIANTTVFTLVLFYGAIKWFVDDKKAAS